MICIKNLTVRNFMSVGNATQAVNFDRQDLTLVLGENLDLGGDGSRNGTGKSQPLTANILTPAGWRKMGDIKVGDKVIAHDGSVSTVLGVFPQGRLETFKVTFADGRSAVASGDHLWSVYSNRWFKKNNSSAKTRTLTTNEILKKLSKYTLPSGKKNSCAYMYTPLPRNITFDKKNLKINPWLLGFLLGDGCLSKKCGIGFSSADPQLIAKTKHIVERELNLTIDKLPGTYDYSINGVGRGTKHPLRTLLENYNLNGCISTNKFIPEDYKNSSIEQRLAVLQGLFDSDGTVDRRTGTPSFTTTSKKLASDVVYIVRSLGGLASTSVKISKNLNHSTAYTVSVRSNFSKELFTLTRKKNLVKENYHYKNRLRARFESIESVGFEECQCIMIDHPDSLYITDDFIVTHNTTIVNALSYALYGNALSNIRKDNLINKTNSKNMLVSVDFSVSGKEYRIERGRRPNILKFYVNNEEQVAADEAQGDSRETQAAIEQTLAMSHDMFKHVLALNTYTEPFLGLRANDQRTIIEQLLGITQLSERAERIKELARSTKDAIREEEFRIRAVQEANQRIEEQIESLKKRQKVWRAKHNEDQDTLKTAISNLEQINIDQEIENHRALDLYNENAKAAESAQQQVKKCKSAIEKLESSLVSLRQDIDSLENHQCHACGQPLHDSKQDEILTKKRQLIKETEFAIAEQNHDLESQQEIVDQLPADQQKPVVFYDTLEDALNHRNSLDALHNNLTAKAAEQDPYEEQIKDMQHQALQTVSYDTLNELTKLQDHQDFLLKLLTSKDSFVRKKIIEQNLSYLNNRLTYYLDRIGLPHSVRFQNDLSVSIEELGRELDFDNLSRGERTRLILSMSWAFRDVWESLYQPINLLFIDELMDNGLDTQGVENGLALLKKISRERNKSIWLVSHKDELAGRVENILKVIKEHGFTNYNNDTDINT